MKWESLEDFVHSLSDGNGTWIRRIEENNAFFFSAASGVPMKDKDSSIVVSPWREQAIAVKAKTAPEKIYPLSQHRIMNDVEWRESTQSKR